MYYYMESIGLKEPWLSNDSFVAASGDDVVAFVNRILGAALERGILENSSRQKEGQIGLGQCIKEVIRGEWYEFDFCSKWAHSPTGKVADLMMVRDMKKALTTRIYYSK